MDVQKKFTHVQTHFASFSYWMYAQTLFYKRSNTHTFKIWILCFCDYDLYRQWHKKIRRHWYRLWSSTMPHWCSYKLECTYESKYTREHICAFKHTQIHTHINTHMYTHTHRQIFFHNADLEDDVVRKPITIHSVLLLHNEMLKTNCINSSLLILWGSWFIFQLFIQGRWCQWRLHLLCRRIALSLPSYVHAEQLHVQIGLKNK